MNITINNTFEKTLISFINEARESIQLLGTSMAAEEGLSSDDEASIVTLVGLLAQDHISYRANMRSADSVNQLRNSGRTINGILLEHPYLLEGCRVQLLSTDFDGESIKRCEDAEWEASCCERLSGNPSQRTLQAINATLVKVQNVRSEAQEMLYHLNPENRPFACCRNFCIIS